MLVEAVILEGFKDDQRYLTEKYPEHAQDLESLPPKWIGWLTARFGERPKTEEIHPLRMRLSRSKASPREMLRSVRSTRQTSSSGLL
jgi:hypothetical protein